MKFKYVISILLTFLMATFMCSCFTGIESTKKITLSCEDKKQVAPTAEEQYLRSVIPAPNTAWISGKKFFVADSRAGLLIDPVRIESGADSLHRGDILVYESTGTRVAPDGRKETAIHFRRGSDTYIYISREGGASAGIVNSDAIPGVIDLEMISAVESLMNGKTFWTRSGVWLDSVGNREEGRKFAPVKIIGISPGTMVFPVNVKFQDPEGKEYYMLMNFGDSGKDSRGFSSLFSLTDPKENYPNISETVWDNIQRGVVEIGMTKEECRLAKGNPSEVNTGHDYSKALLLWMYPDATVLYFEDGILAGINNFGK